jgi:hypothetical protein
MQKPFFAAGKWLDRKGKLCDFAKNNINVAFLVSTMDKVAFPYRSSSHLILMHVVAESGAWEKHGLQVDYDYKIGSLWDLHHLRRLDDAGFIDSLYGNQRPSH